MALSGRCCRYDRRSETFARYETLTKDAIEIDGDCIFNIERAKSRVGVVAAAG